MFYIYIYIYMHEYMMIQDKGKWWLQVQDQVLGYWPESIFTDLASTATEVTWGGEIFDAGNEGHHTEGERTFCE
jgi:hypothetical protein